MLIKKAQIGLIIVIIIIVLIVSFIIIALVISNKKPDTSIENQSNMSLFINSQNENKEYIASNYILMQNNAIIKEGEINDWTEININSLEGYYLYCWNKNYYLSETSKFFDSNDLLLGSSRLVCQPEKIGNIHVSYYGDILSNLFLNISSDYLIKQALICESHSAGFVYLKASYQENKIPDYLMTKADKCWFLGDIKNTTISIDFEIKTFNIINNDKIAFYIIDSDKRFIDNKWVNLYDNKNETIGAEDYKLEIAYSQS